MIKFKLTFKNYMSGKTYVTQHGPLYNKQHNPFYS